MGGGHRLTGTVSCVNGRSLAIDAVAVPGLKGTIAGRLGGAPFTASFKRDPPDPGTPKPRIPSALAGTYKISPRSTCLGGSLVLTGSGGLYRLAAKGQALGRVAYNQQTGGLAGDIACSRGGHARLRASAVDLNFSNVTIPVRGAAGRSRAERPEAQLAAHVEVEPEDVRGELADQPRRRLEVAGLADHGQVVLGLQPQPQPQPWRTTAWSSAITMLNRARACTRQHNRCR